MFTFLETVEPGGGDTAAVTGSQRLLNDGLAVRINDVRSELKREPFFRELCTRDLTERQGVFETTGRIYGVDLEVIELVGEPGNVCLMDLLALHMRRPNTRRTPRMTFNRRFLLASVRVQIKTRQSEPPS